MIVTGPSHYVLTLPSEATALVFDQSHPLQQQIILASQANQNVTINLNADMGESYGRFKVGNDEAILKIINSASIA